MSKGAMKFDKLEIKYEGYSERKLVGEVRFVGQSATVYLKITEKHCQAILDMCSEALLDAAKDMSEVMRGDIIEGMSIEKRIKGFLK